MSDDSSMLSIISSWPDYFKNHDEGLGTTYERFILHNYFEEIKNLNNIKSVLEVPSFGMTGLSGINSLWWAKQGIKPVVIDTNEERISQTQKVWDEIPLPVEFNYLPGVSELPYEDNKFDLTWNFASLWFVKDMQKFINEISRVTQKVIFICVPNRNGIGYLLRKLFSSSEIEGFYPENINHKSFAPLLKTLGWNMQKSGYLDIPPWPDIAMKKEDLFKKISFGLYSAEENNDEKQDEMCIVNYFNGSDIEMEKNILKYSFLEKSPFPIKQLWGHHRYFIFTRTDQ